MNINRIVFRPVYKRLHQSNQRIDSLLFEQENARRQAETLDRRVGALENKERHSANTFDKVLDAISEQNAVARDGRRRQLEENERQSRDQSEVRDAITDLWESQSRLARDISLIEARAEFIRREIMLEVHRSTQNAVDVQAVEAKILDPKKVTERPLRLNVGCGHIPLENFVNVDARELPGVDVVAEARRLPFDPGTVDEVRSTHLIEHFTPTDLKSVLLHWFQVLRPGGILSGVLPDAECMIRAFASGIFSWTNLKEVTFGGQEYAGDYHFAMYSHDDLISTLSNAGFTQIELLEVGRPNGDCLEMEFVAAKPDLF